MADDPYDVGQPIGQVRFYIPDTTPVPQPQLNGAKAFMFSDDELQMLLDRNGGSILLAAADACMVFGTNEMMIGKVITTQDQVTDTSKLMAQYRANAQALREQAAAIGEGPTGDLVGAGIDVVKLNPDPWDYCHRPVLGTFLPISPVTVTYTTVVEDEAVNAAVKVLSAKLPDAIISGSIVRNSNGVVTSAAVIWEDGTTGTYTVLAISPSFPGMVDSYSVTYNGTPATQTFTQPTITRDLYGNATTIPTIVVT